MKMRVTSFVEEEGWSKEELKLYLYAYLTSAGSGAVQDFFDEANEKSHEASERFFSDRDLIVPEAVTIHFERRVFNGPSGKEHEIRAWAVESRVMSSSGGKLLKIV